MSAARRGVRPSSSVHVLTGRQSQDAPTTVQTPRLALKVPETDNRRSANGKWRRRWSLGGRSAWRRKQRAVPYKEAGQVGLRRRQRANNRHRVLGTAGRWATEPQTDRFQTCSTAAARGVACTRKRTAPPTIFYRLFLASTTDYRAVRR